ncbi:type IV secretion protein Rhs [Erwiniaceae bacterium CAU 1747]
MTLDNEIKKMILNIANPPQIIDDWENLADELSDSFEWKGSKIDWSKASKHESAKLSGDYSNWLLSIRKFINNDFIFGSVKSSANIFYINDSSLDFAVNLTSEQLDGFIELAIKNIPQHHYFFDEMKKWCLVISSEGYIDFGLSKK